MSFHSARKHRPFHRDQRGIALVVTLLALAFMLILGVGVIQTAVGSWRGAGNDKMTKSALAIAEAGAEYARETLRVDLRGGATLNQQLSSAANGSPLVDATSINSFSGSTGVNNQTANAPLIATKSFGSGDFQVFLTNDRNEPGAASQSASVQSQIDTNNRIMITSFGTAKGGAIAAVQEQLSVNNAFLAGPSMPAIIVLPGPTVNFQSFNSSPRMINGIDPSTGQCYPTVAVSTNAAKQVVDAAIWAGMPNGNGNGNGVIRPSPYSSCCQPNTSNCFVSPPQPAFGPSSNPSTENFLTTAQNPYDPTTPNVPPYPGDPRLISVSYLKNMVAQVKAVADCHSLSECNSQNPAGLGTTNYPKIAAIDGDVTISGNTTGAGVLLVTGTLTISGNVSYDGVILVIGTGNFIGNGNGNSVIGGSMLVANTSTPWASNPKYVGVPSYQDNGGGNSSMVYKSNSINRYAAAIMPLQLLSFQQLR